MILAHVKRNVGGEWEVHDLEDHLLGVARLAHNFADTFSGGEWAALAGIWHDLGKYSAEFQRYIAQVSGYDPEAHIEGGPGRVDHSTAGALHAIAELGLHGRNLVYLIAGHHAGLPDWHSADTGKSAFNKTRTAGFVHASARTPQPV